MQYAQSFKKIRGIRVLCTWRIVDACLCPHQILFKKVVLFLKHDRFPRRFPRLRQRSCEREIQQLLSECGGRWRTLARHRLEASLHLCDVLDRMANRSFMLHGLPDLGMESFRQAAAAHGSLVMRDALLDEIFCPPPHSR